MCGLRFVALQGTLLPDHLYAFLTDRMRAMKQDIMVQRLHVPPPSPSPSQSSRLVSSDFVATESNSIDITSNTDLDPIRRFSSSVHLLEGMVRFLLLAANFTFFCMLTGPAYSRTHPDSLSSSSRQSATPETRTEIFDAVLHEKMLTDGLSTLLDTYRDFRLCGWCARLRGAKFDGFHPLRYEREFQGYALLLQGGDVHDAGGGSHLNTFLAQLVRQSGSLNVTKSIGTPPTKQAHVAETSIAADTDPLSFCWALVSAYHQRNWVRFFRLYAAVGVRDPLQYECLNSLTAVEEKTANDRESVYAPPLVCFSILQRMYTRPVRLAALSTVSRAFNGWVPLQTLARWLGFASDTDNDNSTSPTLSGSELESEKQTNCFLSQCLPSIKMREAGSEGPASACFQMKPLTGWTLPFHYAVRNARTYLLTLSCTDLKIPPVQQWVLLPQPTTLADVQFFSTPGP